MSSNTKNSGKENQRFWRLMSTAAAMNNASTREAAIESWNQMMDKDFTNPEEQVKIEEHIDQLVKSLPSSDRGQLENNFKQGNSQKALFGMDAGHNTGKHLVNTGFVDAPDFRTKDQQKEDMKKGIETTDHTNHPLNYRIELSTANRSRGAGLEKMVGNLHQQKLLINENENMTALQKLIDSNNGSVVKAVKSLREKPQLTREEAEIQAEIQAEKHKEKQAEKHSKYKKKENNRLTPEKQETKQQKRETWERKKDNLKDQYNERKDIHKQMDLQERREQRIQQQISETQQQISETQEDMSETLEGLINKEEELSTKENKLFHQAEDLSKTRQVNTKQNTKTHDELSKTRDELSQARNQLQNKQLNSNTLGQC